MFSPTLHISLQILPPYGSLPAVVFRRLLCLHLVQLAAIIQHGEASLPLLQSRQQLRLHLPIRVLQPSAALHERIPLARAERNIHAEITKPRTTIGGPNRRT